MDTQAGGGGITSSYNYGYYDDQDASDNDETRVLTPEEQAECERRVLNRVNGAFGTNFTPENSIVQYDGLQGGGANFTITTNSSTSLSSSQYSAIQSGRYSGTLGNLTGFQSSLHVEGSGFGRSNNPTNPNGQYNATFQAHIDSFHAYNPIGAIGHFIVDVLGKNTRDPCPT